MPNTATGDLINSGLGGESLFPNQQAYGADQILQTVSSDTMTNEITRAPFVLYKNHIYLKVMLSDKRLYWFILDSGSHLTFLHEAPTRSLGLHDGATVELPILINGAEYVDTHVCISPFGYAAASYEGRDRDGILGYAIFKNFVVAIDYANQVIELHDPALFRPDKRLQAVPFEVLRNAGSKVPWVKAIITLEGGKTNNNKASS